jgi:CheY-like chemotaxis protein
MAIMGNLSLAQASTRNEARTQALGEAERACLQARQLTWQLLTFARGGVPLKRTLSMSHLLKESVTLALRGSNMTCAFDIAPDLWEIPADEEQLTQVVNNLVVNAKQSMPDGGCIDVRAENIIEAGDRWEHALRVGPGRYIRISITDHGIGIPERHVGRIFDPYFSTKEKSSGLGLATAYSIVKNHGGFVSVASTPGEGTTLTINLPVAMTESATQSRTTVPARSSRILVMDDEASCRSLTARMLNLLGHSVEAVQDGTTAVERYVRAMDTGHPFDAILLDLIVPSGLGGREALERISELDPAVKAIMVSGRAPNSMPADSDDLGFKAIIAKPFTLEELRTTLRTLMVPGGGLVH